MSLEDVRIRNEYAARGLLRFQDDRNLRIFTYTQRCEYSHAWDEITMNSRGHIFDLETGECVARPLRKFFLIEQSEWVKPNWDQPYRVFEKLDGWIGILYRRDGRHRMASRGSFASEGAEWATARLEARHDLAGLPDEATLVFEIISPTTSIIVRYADREELVLLAAFNRHTGEEYPWELVTAWADRFGFGVPRTFAYDATRRQEFLVGSSGREVEGFVIRFADGMRLKIKGQDYLRISALLQNVTPLNVWKSMTGGRVPEAFLQVFDVEMRADIERFRSELEGRYDAQLREITREYEE